jgi:predicted glycosyltransferase
MKIWFDLSNSPHINLFAHLIAELQAEGHEVVITCRPLANTVPLLELHGLRHRVIGIHYGGRLAPKLLGYPIRVLQLWRHLRREHLDVAVSQSSFHSPLAAWLLGVRSIYMNDNEHAMGNVPAFVFATKVMVPEFLGTRRLRRQGADPRRVVHYPGVKEGIYLWSLRAAPAAPALQGPRRPRVYVRPEPWTAQYYKGRRNFMDEILIGVRDRAEVVVLPRGAEQGRHYRSEAFAGIRVVDGALDIAAIVADCDFFVGAGGTMTREMAVLGVPTVSVYQDELLAVDRYLLGVGAFVHEPALTAQRLLELLERLPRRAVDPALLAKGRSAYAMIKHAILHG